eukprot:CAMPEP_0196707132 /NCGR_PEP_ID=MMETSP1090-20130531/63407_1 /TAXON_ID=37098 /ORGANISM="Isochrysis sp, Strain CCMP1244" /LENGTH=167 /DNA_ID=CAMNT_0042047097 /DNA_START=112 /DNA_END=611 /DNA_ORIENTATION=+
MGSAALAAGNLMLIRRRGTYTFASHAPNLAPQVVNRRSARSVLAAPTGRTGLSGGSTRSLQLPPVFLADADDAWKARLAVAQGGGELERDGGAGGDGLRLPVPRAREDRAGSHPAVGAVPDHFEAQRGAPREAVAHIGAQHLRLRVQPLLHLEHIAGAAPSVPRQRP